MREVVQPRRTPEQALREMVEIASSYDRSDTGFWVLGETGGYSVEHDCIRFVGHLRQPELARYYRRELGYSPRTLDRARHRSVRLVVAIGAGRVLPTV